MRLVDSLKKMKHAVKKDDAVLSRLYVQRQNKIIYCFAFLLFTPVFFGLNACTVQRPYVQPGKIPKFLAPSPEAEEFGKNLYQELFVEYDLDSNNQKYDRLIEVFDQLTKAAQVDHLPWHIYLLKGSEIIDIRAVHGNYLFVWSGVFDAVKNDDELAGLLACELSHTLAHHTDPVEFTVASDVLFTVAELATSLSLMVASQGAIAINGNGWMKWAYVEVADLDPLDLEYSKELVREAADIALLILSRTQYCPQALLKFWNRTAADKSSPGKMKRLNRGLTPQERVSMLEKLISGQCEEGGRIATKPPI
jgi:predicted Zn-dependent protease